MLPIRFAFVAPRTGLSVASLVRLSTRRESAQPGDPESLRAHFRGDGSVAQPLTDIGQWGDRYALCTVTFEKLDTEERVVDRLTMNDVVVGVKLTKKIQSTEVVGGKGTVKEYISRDDSELTFTVGVVAVENGELVDRYPLEGLRELRAFFEDNLTVSVYSDFLDALDIDRVVFTDFESTQNTASNYQTVTLKAKESRRYDLVGADW